MNDPAAAVQWTGADIDVGARLVAALVRQATDHPGRRVSGAGLLALARKAHPRDALVARALPLGLAPRLQFVSTFCAAHGYPDLAGLVDPALPDVADAAAYDWAAAAPACSAQLAAFARVAHAAVPARFKPRAERPADVAWYAYFRTHREACQALSPDGKKEVINLLMAGLDPDTALARVLAAQAQG